MDKIPTNNPKLSLTGRSKDNKFLDINDIDYEFIPWGEKKAKLAESIQFVLPLSLLLFHFK